MQPSLRAGIAIYNAGEYHAAHDAWEDHWLDLEEGTEDEQFLHGLIQFTAAIYHARNRNWSGATGLAESAQEYLAGLPETYHGVHIENVRSYLARLACDPAMIERRRPLQITYEGQPLSLDDLDFEETAIAAHVLAEEHGYDEGLIDHVITYAEADLEDDTQNPFVPLVFDFVREPANRPIIAQRMAEHAERRQAKADDVAGLFDPG